MLKEFDAIEQLRSKISEQRKDLHRTVLAKEEEVKQFDTSSFENIEEWDAIDATTLNKELKNAEEHNKKFYTYKEEYTKSFDAHEKARKREQDNQKSIDELDAQIAELQQQRAQKVALVWDMAVDTQKCKEEMEKSKEAFDSFTEIDTSEIRAKLTQVSENQQRIADLRAKKNVYENNKKKSIELRAEWKWLDTQVKKLEQEQNELISWINLSYPMEISEWVMYVKIWEDWIPLDDLNTAMQLEIWTDICLNGPNAIKIITIENANAFDPNTMEKIKEKIEASGAQCFLETVYQTWYEEIEIKDWELKQ